MLLLIFYYLVLPFLLAGLVLKFIRRYGADPSPEAVRRSCAEDPVEPKWYRLVEKRPTATGFEIVKVGDFEARDLAVDAAYAGRNAKAPGVSWLVVNERGDVLEEIA